MTSNMIRLFKKTWEHLWFHIKQPNFKTFCILFVKYRSEPRYKPFYNVKFDDLVFDYPDSLSFIWQYKDIMVDKVYKFKSTTDKPVIIDCGANIGMSVIWLKKTYPTANILAFEADNKIFQFLNKNIERNIGFLNVSIFNKAVWINSEGVSFFSEGADAGHIDDSANNNIPSIRLKDVLSKFEYIDLLKIDIEGAETEVLVDLDDELKKVKNIFVEYHSISNKTQDLSKILSLFEFYGFKYFIKSLSKRNQPFYNKEIKTDKDMQLNIWGYR